MCFLCRKEKLGILRFSVVHRGRMRWESGANVVQVAQRRLCCSLWDNGGHVIHRSMVGHLFFRYPNGYCAADAITPCEPWPILYNIIIKLSSNHTVGSFIMCRTRPCVDQSLHITDSMTQSSRSLERKVDHFRSNPFISEWSVLLYTT